MESRTTPDRNQIAEMELFEGLSMESIMLVKTKQQAGEARDELMSARNVGFDTEAKPTFKKGEKSGGPHVVQFATTEKAYIFQAHCEESRAVLFELLQSAALGKFGFALNSDLAQIAHRFGIRADGIVDLDRRFRQMGYRSAVGAKNAVAMLLSRRMVKSKSVTTSNWSARELTERQLLYAANDAYAAIRVFHALEASSEFP